MTETVFNVFLDFENQRSQTGSATPHLSFGHPALAERLGPQRGGRSLAHAATGLGVFGVEEPRHEALSNVGVR